MSITDSSTAISTTWTENTIVDFNAGTLSSISACVTEVESKIRRGTLGNSTTPTTAEVQRWLIRAKEELLEIRNYTYSRRYAYADTTAGTYRYALPPDFNGGKVSIKDTTNDRFIEVWSDYWFDVKYPDPSAESNDEPQIAAIKNNELWLMPPPSGAYRIQLEYARSGADNTSTDISWMPEPDRFKICDYAVAQAFESLHMFGEADRYIQRWQMGLQQSRRADGKRKWSRMGYQAASCFQVHKAVGYQNRLEN
jgi:hypothetical protein